MVMEWAEALLLVDEPGLDLGLLPSLVVSELVWDKVLNAAEFGVISDEALDVGELGVISGWDEVLDVG